MRQTHASALLLALDHVCYVTIMIYLQMLSQKESENSWNLYSRLTCHLLHTIEMIS